MDLIGIEPMTSSMPWSYQKAIVLTAKDLLAGTVGKTGPICYQCYQFATKKPRRAEGWPVGGQPKLFSCIGGSQMLSTPGAKHFADTVCTILLSLNRRRWWTGWQRIA